MWRRAVRVVRVIRVAPGHNITPELRSDDNIIYTKVYKCIVRDPRPNTQDPPRIGTNPFQAKHFFGI